MSSSLRFWPFGQNLPERTTFRQSPLVANTAQRVTNRQNYTNPCLFSRGLLRSAGSPPFDPLASLAHSWQSVPDCQPQVAKHRDSGRDGQNLADRSHLRTVIAVLGDGSRAISGEMAHGPIALLIGSGQ